MTFYNEDITPEVEDAPTTEVAPEEPEGGAEEGETTEE